MDDFKMVPVQNFVPGPWERDVFYESSIINKLRTDIRDENGIKPQYAVIARKIDDDHYQVIDGGARLLAARQEGISEIPTIIKNVSDEEAILLFLSENTQHSLNNLHVGKLGLMLENENGGRGNVSAKTKLARATGKDRSNLTKYIQSATVFNEIESELTNDEKVSLSKKCLSLCKIVNQPRETWIHFAKFIANDNDEQKLSKSINLVDEVLNIENNEIWLDTFFPLSKMVEMSLKDETGILSIRPVLQQLNKTLQYLQVNSRENNINDLKNYLRNNGFRQNYGTRTFFNFRKVISHCKELTNTQDASEEMFVNGDYLKFLDMLGDASVDSCISDPPFFNNFHDIGDELHPIANNAPAQATDFYNEFAQKLYPKLKENSFVVIFYSPKHIVTLVNAFINEHFKLCDMCTWVKTNGHSQGALITSPLSKCEQFMIFTKGRPVWLGSYNCFLYPSPPRNRQHPMQKPLELIQAICDAVSVPNDLIIDPFAGSGAILKACKLKGRRVAGSEIDPRYFSIAYNNIFGDDNGQVA